MDDRGTIAVTGANRGIGAAIVRDLARRGFAVACLSRRGEAPALGDAVPARPISAFACDVRDTGSLAEAFRAIAEQPGGLMGLVNNAGIHVTGPSERFSDADFAEVLAVNTVGLFAACREAYPFLLRRGGGLIVNLGSFFDRMGVPHNTAYAASKAAVAAITRCLGVEWAAQGVRVVNVAPGYVATELNREYLAKERSREYIERRVPLKRPGTPEEVARLIGALFAEDLPYLIGETIYMDGGHGISH